LQAGKDRAAREFWVLELIRIERRREQTGYHRVMGVGRDIRKGRLKGKERSGFWSAQAEMVEGEIEVVVKMILVNHVEAETVALERIRLAADCCSERELNGYF
jgi:hypothetical protein